MVVKSSKIIEKNCEQTTKLGASLISRKNQVAIIG